MPRQRRFDTEETMPETFRERLVKVLRDPPDSQHDFYPELMAYFGLKFAVEKGFMLKPQKMLRLLAGMSEHDYDEGYGSLSGGEPVTFTQTIADRNLDMLSATTAGSAHTTDSNAREVRITWHNSFPDVAIEQFFGRQYRGVTDNAIPDILRVLVEVGWCASGLSESKRSALRRAVVAQLMGYMSRARKAWTGKLWGIAIIRTHFTYVEWDQPDTTSTNYILAHASGDWHPLDSPQFIELLNRIQKWCLEQYRKHVPLRVSPAITAKFDLAAKLPSKLQERFDDWKIRIPRQYSAYGPFMAYLGWIFPLDKYMVKPQRRIEKQTPLDNPHQVEDPNNRRGTSIDVYPDSASHVGSRDNRRNDREEDKDKENPEDGNKPEGEDLEEILFEEYEREDEREKEAQSDTDDVEYQYDEESEDEPDDEERGARPDDNDDDVEEPYAEERGEGRVTNDPTGSYRRDEDVTGTESVSAVSTQLEELRLEDPTTRACYPDFTVDKYQAAGNAGTDQISLIVEIGKAPNTKDSNKTKDSLRANIQEQLHGYMIASLKHFDRQLYGIAVCGTDFCYMRATDSRGERRLTTGQNVPAGEGSFRANVRWGSIFAARWEKIMRSASRS